MTRPRPDSGSSRRGPARRVGLLLLAGVACGGLFLLGGGAGAAAGPGAARPAVPLAAPTIAGVTVAATEQEVTGDDGTRLATDRRLTIDGSGFFGTSFGPFVHFVRGDGSVLEAPFVMLESPQRIVASPPRGTYGQLTVVVENPDHQRATFQAGL